MARDVPTGGAYLMAAILFAVIFGWSVVSVVDSYTKTKRGAIIAAVCATIVADVILQHL